MANDLTTRTTSNPVLSRPDIFTREGTVGFHDAPAAHQHAPSQQDVPVTAPAGAGTPTVPGVAMTINDVVVKTALLFVVGAVGVAISWASGYNLALTWGAMIVGFVIAMVNIFKRQVSPPLVMLYALCEGVFLAGVSAMYQSWVTESNPNAPNIVLQAVIGTATAFAVMLALYSSGKLRATPMFQKIMITALFSYLIIALASFVSAVFFDVGNGFGFYGVGWLGLALCAGGVLLAAFTLILDFDAIQKGVAAGAPERESWRAAFGLLVTLVWLYLEILRLLAILQGGRR